jgi:hypothetical protein
MPLKKQKTIKRQQMVRNAFCRFTKNSLLCRLFCDRNKAHVPILVSMKFALRAQLDGAYSATGMSVPIRGGGTHADWGRRRCDNSPKLAQMRRKIAFRSLIKNSCISSFTRNDLSIMSLKRRAELWYLLSVEAGSLATVVKSASSQRASSKAPRAFPVVQGVSPQAVLAESMATAPSILRPPPGRTFKNALGASGVRPCGARD